MKIVNINFLYFNKNLEKKMALKPRKNVLVLKKIRSVFGGVNLAIISIIENYIDPR